MNPCPNTHASQVKPEQEGKRGERKKKKKKKNTTGSMQCATEVHYNIDCKSSFKNKSSEFYTTIAHKLNRDIKNMSL